MSKSMFKKLSLIFLLPACSFMLLLYFLPLPPLLDAGSFSTAVYDKNEQLLRLTLNRTEKYRLFVPLKDMAPELIAGTLLQEDQYFYHHPGINPWAMVKALMETWIFKSRRMGASTITMQLARMRFDIQSKTFKGKFVQIFRALQMEMHHNKDEILEAYLNLAPYGGNIEGAGAASLIYFQKSVKNLTLPEALTLSIIPQNPNHRTPASHKLKTIRKRLFERWLLQHPNDRNKTSLMNLPLEMTSRNHLPFYAPHFVQDLLSHETILPQSLQTTLDLKLQKVTERVLKHYLQRKKNIGAYNAAALLIDSRDMSVLAMAGSADFFNDKISGQMNGTSTRRSPGSTLKPFIYALALDQGLIHPATVLKDVPHSFGSYNPENFDYDFMGPVKARDALILSRNIPAVFLASLLKNPSLYQLLYEAGVSQLKSEPFYGLSLAMGGAELNAQELAALYAMLANEGVWRPLRMLKNDPVLPGKRLLSMEASYLVLDILKNTSPPNGNTTHKVMPAFKTGTSSGYRDAWTAGVLGPYVLTVWIGNFDNKGNPSFIGRELAAPLFFEWMNALMREIKILPESEKSPAGMNLIQIDVCKASGMLPSLFCPETEKTWFIPGKSPIVTDNIYREAAINPETGLRTCHIDENTRFEIFEFWPSDLLKTFRKAGIIRHSPPFFEDGCGLNEKNHSPPKISSPKPGLSYVLRTSTSNHPIPLNAVTAAGVKYIYWFANNTFIGKIRADETLFWPGRQGKWIIRAVDDQGFSDVLNIAVILQD